MINATRSGTELMPVRFKVHDIILLHHIGDLYGIHLQDGIE
jgi:hypothetical protein